MRTRAAAALGAVAAVVAGSLAAAPVRAATAPAPVWTACATPGHPTLQCASVRVPLNHADPAGRQITLALSRVPHTARTSEGPLLVNPGGPGGSGLELAGFVASALPKSVAARYDVIGFDPRGVGRSTPALTCAPGHFAAPRPDSVPASPALERANLDRARSFAEACGRRYADVLPYLDTVSAARDLDVVRRALGAPRVSYFGYSYGTYLGAVYAKLYPGRVHRLVLDSIVDPAGVWYADNLAQDHAFDDRHRALMAWIARHDAVYGLGTDPARIEARWYAMRAALAREPAGAGWAPRSWRTPSRPAATTTATGPASPRRSRPTSTGGPPGHCWPRTTGSPPWTPRATTATASTRRCSAGTPPGRATGTGGGRTPGRRTRRRR